MDLDKYIETKYKELETKHKFLEISNLNIDTFKEIILKLGVVTDLDSKLNIDLGFNYWDAIATSFKEAPYNG